jgi:hypothetical protein
MDNNAIVPVIVCIAKNEYNYIEEFVKYHLALGFSHIYLYDNQDVPNTYVKILEKYIHKMTIIHIAGNNHKFSVQGIILNHFQNFILKHNKNITHAAHIDIDEYIVLKKHKNISELIKEYIKGDCSAIGMNWKFFGSSGHTNYTSEPITSRFTKYGKNGDKNIKTICDVRLSKGFDNPHYPELIKGYNKSTNGDIIIGPFNFNPCYDIVQINHYKCKTLEEYKTIRLRGRADKTNKDQPSYNVKTIEEDFKQYDLNDVEDLTAKHFYENIKEI